MPLPEQFFLSCEDNFCATLPDSIAPDDGNGHGGGGGGGGGGGAGDDGGDHGVLGHHFYRAALDKVLGLKEQWHTNGIPAYPSPVNLLIVLMDRRGPQLLTAPARSSKYFI